MPRPKLKDDRPRQLLLLRLRVALQSFGLAVLMAAIATLSIVIFRGQLRSLRNFRWFAPAARASAGAVVVAVASSAAHQPNLLHDQALVKVAPEPDATVEPPKHQSGPERHFSASELFALAESARDRGDLPEAITRSEQIEQFFPSSPEGIATHLLLGLIYLQESDPNRALGELAMYRHIGNPETMAEALWAQAEALQQLGRASDEREILEELLKNFPRSVYVAAAKQRLSALPAP
jgi:tetratricopeptide (TPR) repeat protein